MLEKGVKVDGGMGKGICAAVFTRKSTQKVQSKEILTTSKNSKALNAAQMMEAL